MRGLRHWETGQFPMTVTLRINLATVLRYLVKHHSGYSFEGVFGGIYIEVSGL